MSLERLFQRYFRCPSPAGFFVMFVCGPALANEALTLTWEALSPALPDLRGLFRQLTDEQFAELYELHQLVQWRRTGEAAADRGLAQLIEELTVVIKAQLLDSDALLRKLAEGVHDYERVQSTPVADLNGRTVRLPGFVLPLEFGGAETVREFFLVPYVGACIHTPPPPANQIVLVKLNQSYKVNSLYDPVWVTGRLKIVTNDRKLGYSDGAGRVASAYELDGINIVPYQ